MTDQNTNLEQALACFHGSENLYFHPLFKAVRYTDGVHYLIEHCAWLVTDIQAIVAAEPTVSQTPFVCIYATPDTEGGAKVIYENGDCEVIYKQNYDYAELPCPVKLFYVDNVLMLASEY